MYVGVRAGGGIGDEIEDPAGDPYELYRILFDITFFFFVIVILLAIIQGALRVIQRFHLTQSAFYEAVCFCARRSDHRCLWRAERSAGTSQRGHGGEAGGKERNIRSQEPFGDALFRLQTKCFICGIGNDYFDTTPHGFETHTLQEHNLANYL